MRKVVIEVSGGVADVTGCPSDVEVEIIDHDNEECGESGLLQEHIDRQDYVDNACRELLCNVTEQENIWDIELIGKLRDVVQEIIVDDMQLCTRFEFYPWVDPEEEDQE